MNFDKNIGMHMIPAFFKLNSILSEKIREMATEVMW